jgi:hypothetical protein
MHDERSGDLLGHDGRALWPVCNCQKPCPGIFLCYGCNGQVSCHAESSCSEWLMGSWSATHTGIFFCWVLLHQRRKGLWRCYMLHGWYLLWFFYQFFTSIDGFLCLRWGSYADMIFTNIECGGFGVCSVTDSRFSVLHLKRFCISMQVGPRHCLTLPAQIAGGILQRNGIQYY